MSSDCPTTLKLVDHSDHYTSMIELGLPASVEWLLQLDGKTKMPSVDQGQDRKNPPEQYASSDRPRRDRDSMGRISESEERVNSARDRALEELGITPEEITEQPIRLKPFYDSAESAYANQLAVLIANDGALDERMRFWIAGKRPTIGFRFAVGVLFSGKGQRFETANWTEFRNNLGPFGTGFVSWLNGGSLTDVAGNWPKVKLTSSGIGLVGASDELEVLKKKARKQNLDCLIAIVITQRIVRKKWIPTFQLRLVDLHGRVPPWESKIVSNRKIIQEGADGMLFQLEQFLEGHYGLRDMPNMTEAKATRRVAMMKTANEDREWLVLETCYYYQTGRIARQLAREKLGTIAPKLDGSGVLSDTPKIRYQSVLDWLD